MAEITLNEHWERIPDDEQPKWRGDTYIVTHGQDGRPIPYRDGLAGEIESNLAIWMAWGREIEQAAIEAREAAVQELVRARQTQDISSIAFVAMAQAGQIDDVTISEYPQQFTAWRPDMTAMVGQIMRYSVNGKLYRVVQAHTTQADWTPDATPALFACISDPADPWPQWAQPVGAHDAYGLGDRVTHNGARWASDVTGNVWEPGVYGWTQQAG